MFLCYIIIMILVTCETKNLCHNMAVCFLVIKGFCSQLIQTFCFTQQMIYWPLLSSYGNNYQNLLLLPNMFVAFFNGWYQGLTYCGRVTHICVGKLAIIGSDNGLSPGRRQAIIWTNVGILLTGPPRTNISEILIRIPTFSFKKMHLKMSSGRWQPFCLGLYV